jgi:hypothetical protein
MRLWCGLLLGVCGVLMVACNGGGEHGDDGHSSLAVVDDIAERRAQLVVKSIGADLETLSAGDREALEHLVRAAKAMDDIFRLQAWTLNPVMARHVAAYHGPDADAVRDYYRIMYGPWDRLADLEPFIGETPRPPGAGYYPPDLTKEELEAWIEENPADAHRFRSLHTVIRRQSDDLLAVPYSTAYRGQLQHAAAELRAAADATDNASLAKLLRLRAKAFMTDDYYESDLAWMDLDSPLEVVIGPYETYEDRLFGYKAAFEAFLCVVAPEDSEQLARFKGELPALERSLPIPDEHKNLDRGTESPIRVANEVFVAGDARAGVQTLAFNLPNDERVREAKGSKKVLLKNMMQAKYEAILDPISEQVLPPETADRIAFDAYYLFVLFHEMAHGLGPGRITVDGRETEVRMELKEHYTALEEAKADSLGARNLYVLGDRELISDELLEALPWTYVAGLFRSARFGTTAAHGLGVVIQMNWLLEAGAIEVTEDGRFRPVPEELRAGLESLVERILMIQAEGAYEQAALLVAQYGTVRPEMQAVLDGLDAIPVDIDPVYAWDPPRE